MSEDKWEGEGGVFGSEGFGMRQPADMQGYKIDTHPIHFKFMCLKCDP